ncbi:MAG TPA: von Willebrand factor type A domain-containing protein, partial [Beijerinckiaceae bacterium]|nr:von Willebrand factor type A domain-containing protein [Beijerinckiaceae bacterium]
MSDDQLKVLLPDPPSPSPEAKRGAVDAALARFDETFPSRDAQASDAGVRLTERTGAVPRRNHGTDAMTRTKRIGRTQGIAASLFLTAGLIGAGTYVFQQQGEHRTPALNRASGEAHVVQSPHVSARHDEIALPKGSAPAPSPPASRPADGRVRAAKEREVLRVETRQAVPSEAAPVSAPPRIMAGADTGRALPPLPERPPVAAEPHGRDQFAGEAENPFKVVREHPVSTFSADVDTASYSFVRASLNRNTLPAKAAVRTEELVNYFPYAYPAPSDARESFRTTVSVFPSPWNEGRRIVHIGIKGYAVQPAERPRANLVFLIDTSGSMNAPNRLPLAKQALAMLVDQLDARDSVAIVTYAGSAGTALEPTPASQKAKILAAIERLESGGSTAGAEGIRQAYALAEASFDANGVNRVLLATDGDFNVGITSRDELKGFVERKREKGIFLSVLGFGMGNYNDALMQALAQNGNGTAAYIDTL